MESAAVQALTAVKARVSADFTKAMSIDTDEARGERITLERVMIYLDEAMTEERRGD